MSLSPDETRATKSEDAGGTAQPQHENSTEEPEGNPTAMHGFKLWAIFIGICFGAFLMSLDIFVIATAIPSITSDFKDTSQLAWYPAAYSLTTNSFIVGRAVAGIGASGVASGGFVIVLTVASDKAKPLLMGICSSCFAMGLILAPVIGGAFTQKATWRWCFWVNLPPGAVTLVAMLLFFKPPSIQRDRKALQRIKNLDLIGCAIFIPAIFMLLLAMMWGGTEKPWGSATIIGLFVGSGVTLMLFVGWEHYKGDGAMIPGNLIVRRTITFSVLFSFCHFGSLGILNYYLPEWFQAVEGASPLESGTRVLASVLAQIVGTLSSGIRDTPPSSAAPWD
ncbi:hypothetical protein N7467_004669 [Penicillium canescens]|nr:hypothetical protein N7467_004669 [Penicillium canescens]